MRDSSVAGRRQQVRQPYYTICGVRATPGARERDAIATISGENALAKQFGQRRRDEGMPFVGP